MPRPMLQRARLTRHTNDWFDPPRSLSTQAAEPSPAEPWTPAPIGHDFSLIPPVPTVQAKPANAEGTLEEEDEKKDDRTDESGNSRRVPTLRVSRMLQRDPLPGAPAPPTAPADRPPALNTPPAQLSAIPHEGTQLTRDAGAMRKVLINRIERQGWDDTDSWAYRFINMDWAQKAALGLTSGGDEFVKQVNDTLKGEIEKLRDERKTFLTQFEDQATTITREVLDNSEKQIKAELDRMGVKVEHGMLWDTYSMKGDVQQGLRDGARRLAGKRREVNGLLNAFLRAKKAVDDARVANPFIMDDALLTAMDAARDPWVAGEEDYKKLRGEVESTNPILATYSTGNDAVTKLEALANASSSDMAQDLQATAKEKLANIAQVRKELGGRFSVWDQPSIVQVTHERMKAEPWQIKVTQEKKAQIKSDAADKARMFAVVAIGLGLLSAIPTGGTSLLAGVAAAGAALSAAYSIYQVYEHYQDYSLAKAANATAFDKAKAISKEDPSLEWLAADIVTVILDMVGAKAAFTTLRLAMAAAVATKLEKMPELLVLAREKGLTQAVRGRIISKVVSEAGGPKSVQLVLDGILKKFARLSPAIDEKLARAFQSLAIRFVEEGRVGIVTIGATEAETLAEIKRALAASSRKPANIDNTARTILADIQSPTTGGGYVAKYDIIVLKQGESAADAFAHELAHACQKRAGAQLQTLESEYQAFTAQRDFLLMLPTSEVPQNSLWLLRATDADIEAHVLKAYEGKIMQDLGGAMPAFGKINRADLADAIRAMIRAQ
jgi:hypothetical protein